jgi:hypothetical protein
MEAAKAQNWAVEPQKKKKRAYSVAAEYLVGSKI